MWLILGALVVREIKEAVAGEVMAGVIWGGSSCWGLFQVQGPWRRLGEGELVGAVA